MPAVKFFLSEFWQMWNFFVSFGVYFLLEGKKKKSSKDFQLGMAL